MNFSPTPGAWLTSEQSNRITTQDGRPVATCLTGNVFDRRLIARAPEMFRLLEAAILAEQDTWDGPHKAGSMYSEPKWLTESRALVVQVRQRV
jgi:hypothetical protein